VSFIPVSIEEALAQVELMGSTLTRCQEECTALVLRCRDLEAKREAAVKQWGEALERLNDTQNLLYDTRHELWQLRQEKK
jgi:hypothetical protein